MKTITIITYTTGIEERLPEGWEAYADGIWLCLAEIEGRNKRFIPAHIVFCVEVRAVAA